MASDNGIASASRNARATPVATDGAFGHPQQFRGLGHADACEVVELHHLGGARIQNFQLGQAGVQRQQLLKVHLACGLDCFVDGDEHGIRAMPDGITLAHLVDDRETHRLGDEGHEMLAVAQPDLRPREPKPGFADQRGRREHRLSLLRHQATGDPEQILVQGVVETIHVLFVARFGDMPHEHFDVVSSTLFVHPKSLRRRLCIEADRGAEGGDARHGIGPMGKLPDQGTKAIRA